MPDANMLCCSLRHEGVELLGQRRGVEAYTQRGKTMGVPLLYPWANRLSASGYSAAGKTVTLPEEDHRVPRDPNGLPLHGVLPSLLRWEVEGDRAGDTVDARLAWTAPELLELFPYVHEVRVRATVGAGSLTIATSVLAVGEDHVPVSFGYHPYLAVPGGDRTAWRVTLGASEHLQLDDRGIPTGERDPVAERSFLLGDRSLDDGFAGIDLPALFSVSSVQATLQVEFRGGYPFAQAFTTPDGELICFEPMSAPTNALRSGDGLPVVPPGGRYEAEFTLRYSSSRNATSSTKQ